MEFDTVKKIALTIPLIVLAVTGPQLAQARTASITMAQARAIALKAAPGKIEKAEQEREGGALRYSFDIRQGNRIHEIGVDVVTGKIVEEKYEALNARD